MNKHIQIDTNPELAHMGDEQLRNFILTDDFGWELEMIGEMIYEGHAEYLASGQKRLLDFLDEEIKCELTFRDVLGCENPTVWQYRLGAIYDHIENIDSVTITYVDARTRSH